jgi:magnesium and cobalt transporter
MSDPGAPNDRSGSDDPAAPGTDSTGSGSQGGGLIGWLRKLMGSNGEGGLRETLEGVIEEHGDTDETLDPEQREMLLNIVEFGELQVDDIMVPRTDIIGVDAAAPLSELIATFRQAHHSRLPVYRGNLDEIAGFVHIKDVIDFWDSGEAFDLKRVLRQLLIVPPSMPAIDLLARMRATRLHMAVVVDEYGGTDGLVTIEDVVEEIVGEIEDEHDVSEGPLLVEREDGNIEADGRAEIEDLEAILHVDLLPDEVDEEVDTLGGLVFTMLGRIPDVGEVIRHDCGLEIEVTDADARRIKRLLLRRPQSGAAANSAD